MYLVLRKHIKIIIAITLLLSSIQTSRGQQLGLDILGDEDKLDIPFEYVQGFLIIELRLQRFLPMRFLFDTGAEHSVLFKKELTDVLNIKYDRTVRILGADLQKSMVAHLAKGTDLKVPNAPSVKRDILVLEDNELFLEGIIGKHIDGILGASFFRGLIVRINYDKKKITVFNPKKFKEPNTKKYTKLPIQLISYKPYLDCKIKDELGNIQNAKILVDTGAALGFLYHSNMDNTIQLPEKLIPGSLGKGLGGDLLGYIGKTKQLSFGPFEFNELLTNFQDLDGSIIDTSMVHRSGLIGNVLLSRFDVYIDYIHHYIYLKSKKNYNKELSYDKSGIILYTVGQNLKQYFVKGVIKDSPAYRAGVRPGDYLKSISWLPLRFYNLSRITNKLSGKHGKKIKLKVKRGEQIIPFTFFLEDPFYKPNDE